MRQQPEYLKQLETLPPKLREAWLYGSWDVYEGQFFEDFRDVPEHYEDRQWDARDRAVCAGQGVDGLPEL